MVEDQTKHGKVLGGVVSRAEMAGHRGGVGETDVAEVFRETIRESPSGLADIQGLAQRTLDAVDKVSSGAGEGVTDAKCVVVRTSDRGAVGNVGTGVAAGSGTREGTWAGRTGDGVGGADKKVAQVTGSCEGGEGGLGKMAEVEGSERRGRKARRILRRRGRVEGWKESGKGVR